MRRHGIQRSVRRALLCAALGVIAAPANANLRFWDGGGADNDWSTSGNWSSFFGVPANDGTDDIIMAGTLRLTPLVDIDYDILSLQFNATAGAFAFQAGGQDLFIRGGGIINNDTDLQIVSRVVLGANHTWNAAAGPLQVNFITLGSTFGRALTVAGTFDTSIQGTIFGSTLTNSGSIILNSNANLTLAGLANNSFSGAVTVNSGTLLLNKPAGIVAVPGNLIIGDGAGSDVVKLFQNNQIADTSNLTINSSGRLNLNGHSETIGNLMMTGGTVDATNGIFSAGSVTFNGASATAAITGGKLDLGAATRTFAVADGPAALDTEISSVIDNGSLIKTGPGRLRFSGPNTYTGTTTVNEGILELNAATFSITGDLVIGDGIGGAGSDRVVLLAPNQIHLPFYPGVPHPVVSVRSSGLFQMNGLAQGIDMLVLDGGAAVDIGAGGTLTVEKITCTGIGNAPVTIDGNNLRKRLNGVITFDVVNGPAADDMILSVHIQEFNSIFKTGTGQLVLAGTLANEGGCNIAAGTVVLAKSIADGAGFISVAASSTARWAADEQVRSVGLTQLGGGTMNLNGFSETLNGLSVGSLGTVVTGGGRLTVTQQLQLQDGGSINTGIGTLQLGGILEVSGAAQSTVTGNLILDGTPFLLVYDGSSAIDLEISAQIGGGGFQKVPGTFGGGEGHVLLSGPANTNTGSITVAVGKLSLNKSGVDGAVRGGLVIGDGAESDVVQLLSSEQILAAPQCPVLITTSGLLDLNGFDETLLNLTFDGGSAASGAGILAVTGQLIATGAAASMISGKLNLDGGTRTFVINDGPAGVDLDVAAIVSGGGLSKQGLGTLRLTANNDFSGGLVFNAGRLIIGNDGAAGTGELNLGGGTLEGTNGTRTLTNPIRTGAPVTIAGPVDLVLSGPFDNSGGNGITKTGSATLIIAGAQSHGPGATLDVVDGGVRLQSDAGSASAANLILRVVGVGAQAHLDATQHLAAVNVNAGSAAVTPGGSKVLHTKSLNVDTTDALIDVWEHALIVDYASASPLASIKSAIASAYHNGAWDGFGITSSLADATTHGLGYAESSAIFSTFPANFEGEPIDNAAILIKLTRFGDANLDGTVNAADLGALASHWQQSSQYWTGGDFTYDGMVDLRDLYLLASNWQAGASLDTALSSLSLPAVGVPEPGLLLIVALGGLSAGRRRRA